MQKGIIKALSKLDKSQRMMVIFVCSYNVCGHGLTKTHRKRLAKKIRATIVSYVVSNIIFLDQ